MEPAFIQYIKQLVKTICIIIIWMGINVKFGIMNNYAFFEDSPQTSNIIFYLWMIISLVSIIFYLKKVWATPLDFEDQHQKD